MRRWILRSLLIALALLIVLPILASGGSIAMAERKHWSTSRWDSAGLAPDPAAVKDAVVQVYGARLWGWRGALAVHTWIVVKPAGAPSYTRYEVVGWGSSPVRISQRVPDGYWAGNAPELLLDMRGPEAAFAIPLIIAAAERYPGREKYVMWPGPNSNSFVAYIARQVPELGLHLPPTAIGKDWIGTDQIFAPAPSGTGWQISLFGLAGVTAAVSEGIELNLLGLTLGVDLLRPALKLPGIGRLGMPAHDGPLTPFLVPAAAQETSG
ncbi:DUF3750 domain-containing protein [uncultured Ferrovibrio sp.]|uniref:DUF3750 domain-containing protein n=1 Tax=uncultured Ferrovibrio sp. TaxID=1576913 RepID=UPI00262C8E3F|nr:DUF3750 domain-containing protein [uncultured Ferrovibrio sp.]